MTAHQSPQDPCENLNSLGRVCSYRADLEATRKAVELISGAFEGYQAQLLERETVEERALFALEVVQEILEVSRSRAGDCIEQHEHIACENIDVFDLLGEWAAYAQSRIPA